MPLHNDNEEVYEIKNDVKDPTGQSDARGTQMTMDMTRNALAHPKFRWQNKISECDLYKAGDRLLLSFFCPKCGNHNQLRSEKKELRWEPGVGGGRLSLERFRCTWPGCGLHIEVNNNIAKEV
jgi:hypothetical protein